MNMSSKAATTTAAAPAAAPNDNNKDAYSIISGSSTGGAQTRFSFYNAADFVQRSPVKSPAVTSPTNMPLQHQPTTPSNVHSSNSSVSAEASEILKSLQEHEQQRHELLSAASKSKSSAGCSNMQSPVAAAAAEAAIHQVMNNNNAGAYEDAIKEALDLLRKHRQEQDGDPDNSNTAAYVEAQLQQLKTPPEADRVLQSRLEKSPDATTPNNIGEAYQAEIEARRKQRQERMARYASRLAELKQEGAAAASGDMQQHSTSSDEEAINPWVTSPTTHESSAAQYQQAWEQARDAAVAATHRSTRPPAVRTLSGLQDEYSDEGGDDDNDNDDEGQQRGAEKVLLAILEEAHKTRDETREEEKKQHAEEENSSSSYANHRLATTREYHRHHDKLDTTMSDLLLQNSTLSSNSGMLDNKTTLLASPASSALDGGVAPSGASQDFPPQESFISEVDSNSSSAIEPGAINTKATSATASSMGKLTATPGRTSAPLETALSDDSQNPPALLRPKRSVDSASNNNAADLDYASLRDASTKSSSIDERVRRLLSDDDHEPSPVRSMPEPEVQKSYSSSRHHTTTSSSGGARADDEESLVTSRSSESGSASSSSSSSSSPSSDTKDDTIDDDGSSDSEDDDIDTADDSNEGEESQGHLNDSTLDGVLGPLSKVGGASGVVLEPDSPKARPEMASPSILDSFSAAMSTLAKTISKENSHDKSSDPYSSTQDDGDDDSDDDEATELMRSLCAHLLPIGVPKSSRVLDKLPEWDDANPDEAGYRIIRLTRSQLADVERAFTRMVNDLRVNAQRKLENGSDESFERDLRDAELLLDQAEGKAPKVSETKPADTSASSDMLSKDVSESDCLPAFPGVKPTGKGEMGELEYFHLPVIFKSHVTGFEPTKDMLLEPGNIVAGQYLVEGELGSAAFSTAYRCVDLNSEDENGEHEEVALKVIKNTKDFFDQSLDEIKILELLRQTGVCHDNYIIEMKTFFYHREHLVIVTELLRQNLFEFGKFIIDNNEEPYFTLPRLAYITRQILIALRFVHRLGLIHSDVKPENILLGSYSRAKAKLIDFGSSCYLTDRQSSYIQSRSYRAPEVILGLPYDGRIDIWSLGCVVAEMFTGEVTFQNDSIVSMMSRIEAICGPFPRHMVVQGRQSDRFFTKIGLLFEKVSKREKRPQDSADDDDDDSDDAHPSSDEDEEEEDESARGRAFVDIFQPKITALAARLGFASDLMERYDGNKKLSKDETKQAMFCDFCRQLLNVDAEARATAAQALEHPWMQYAATLTEDDIMYPSS